MRTCSQNPQNSHFAPSGAADELAAAIEAATGQVLDVAWTDPMDRDEIREVLSQLLMSPRPDRGLEVLVRTELIEAIMPEVAALVGFGEGVRHKDVWNHTKKVLQRTPPRLEIRWAALLHDIGKVPTRKFESDGQVTFLGHPEVGARMFEKIARRFLLPEPLRERVRFLIASHLRASSYSEYWTDSAVRRFTKDTGDALDDLLDLSRADITSKHTEKVRRGTRQINLLAERVAKLKEADAKPKPLPKGLGTAIMGHFDISPGPALGNLMHRLAAAVEAGQLGVQEDYDHYLNFLEQNRYLLESILLGGNHDKR
ncbi:MAG: HD domain-containing protein [Proteobacteria bacterium]|nr:HD domain-containing protein [Pseudomonadota bacterium]